MPTVSNVYVNNFSSLRTPRRENVVQKKEEKEHPLERTSKEINKRYPWHHVPKLSTKTMALMGSTLGTAAAMLYVAKTQGKNLKNIKEIMDVHYGVKEIIAVGTSSVVGGVAFGAIADPKDDNIPKVKEGIYQEMNIVVPALCTDNCLKVVDASKKMKDSRLAKIGAIGAGVTGGMLIASAVANFINDPNNNEKDREITPKDVLANADDALGALVLAKFPLVEKLKLHRIIPPIFAWCGFRAGQSN